jgi:molybdate/tungstate transport system permease protein
MSRRQDSLFFAFGLLASLLLIELVLPIGNLLWRADWPGWMAALAAQGEAAALTTSLVSSLITVLVMLVCGVPLGYLLAQDYLPLRRFWTTLLFLPMVLPDLAGGILLLKTFGPYGVVGGPLATRGVELTGNLAGIILAQVFVAAPFVIISALAAFGSVDPKLEAAAATLGDSPWRIFWRVSLPLAWPGIAGGLTLAWIRALGEFGATMIMAYNPHTLPVYLWVKFESDGLGGALPVAFCLVLLAAGAVAISVFLNRAPVRAELAVPRQIATGA